MYHFTLYSTQVNITVNGETLEQVTKYKGVRTLRHQDTSASRHFGTGAEVSLTFRHRSQR